MSDNLTYEKDFYRWLMHTAELIREKKFTELDTENVAEELESMGRGEKRELISRLAVLLAHLLKWQFQAEKQSRSWKNTLAEQRLRIRLILEDSPSFTHSFDEKLIKAYNLALSSAEKETGLRKDTFPPTCPYSFEQIMNEDFYPAASGGPATAST